MIPIAHNSRAELKQCMSCRIDKPSSAHYFYKDRKTNILKDVCKDCTPHRGKNRNSLTDVLKKYEVSDSGCWLYTGKIDSGYGIFYYQSSRLRAHRVSYELEFGQIPDGLVLDHLCGNKSCINPKHLEPIKQGDNSRRWFSSYKHCETCSCEVV